jgi:hypothetical protein
VLITQVVDTSYDPVPIRIQQCAEAKNKERKRKKKIKQHTITKFTFDHSLHLLIKNPLGCLPRPNPPGPEDPSGSPIGSAEFDFDQLAVNHDPLPRLSD